MIKITRKLLRAADSCYGAAREKELIPIKGLTIREVAQLDIPTKDKIWAICKASNAPDNTLREFACWCARNALNTERKAGREPDPRSWAAVDVAERYARGEASKAERTASYRAAFGAASDAASFAAYYAAYYAANAARNTACNVASYAAYDAACGAYYAVFSAASYAPSGSARRAIRRRQLKKLVNLLS